MAVGPEVPGEWVGRVAVFSRMGCVEMDLPGLKRPRFFVKAKFVVTLLDLEAESEELN